MSVEVLNVNIEELRKMVDDTVEEKLAVLLRDAENDMEFSDDLKKILARQLAEVKNGKCGEALSDVSAGYDWKDLL